MYDYCIRRSLTPRCVDFFPTAATSGFTKEVASSLLRLESLPIVTVRNNPWEKPPQAVVETGLKATVRYFEDTERSGSLKSWMLKVVLVGAVCAGKSSVVESLRAGKPEPVPLAKRTRGVDVHMEDPFKPDASKPVELVFWDFAGHEEYHSTHSLFLSSEALFLLVVDLARFVQDPSSKGDSIYKWLDTLLCRIPGAVVQIVATHTDDDRIGGQEEAVNSLRQTVAGHLTEKRLEHERGRKERDTLAPPTLKIIYKIHAVSCTTGKHWPAFGKEMAHLVAEGTTKYLSEPSSDTGETTGHNEKKLFRTMGQEIPTIWARAGAVMNALRDGVDPVHAATLPPQPETWKAVVAKAQVRFISWEDARLEWEKAVTASGLSNEIGSDGAIVLEVFVLLSHERAVRVVPVFHVSADLTLHALSYRGIDKNLRVPCAVCRCDAVTYRPTIVGQCIYFFVRIQMSFYFGKPDVRFHVLYDCYHVLTLSYQRINC